MSMLGVAVSTGWGTSVGNLVLGALVLWRENVFPNHAHNFHKSLITGDKWCQNTFPFVP